LSVGLGHGGWNSSSIANMPASNSFLLVFLWFLISAPQLPFYTYEALMDERVVCQQVSRADLCQLTSLMMALGW
jgi:hypothetical protein